MGRQKKDGNHSPPNNKLVQEAEGNEENGHPDPDSNKRKINYTKEPNKAPRNTIWLLDGIHLVDMQTHLPGAQICISPWQ
jgi:hypothetical protein